MKEKSPLPVWRGLTLAVWVAPLSRVRESNRVKWGRGRGRALDVVLACLTSKGQKVKRSKGQKLNCLKSKAVSPPLRGGDLLSCLAKKVGKEGDPDA
ncbi:hypothetical protein, partial [Cupriavidus sp. 8B]